MPAAVFCTFNVSIKLHCMHRVIIPLDFSETSLNAARYTAQMLAGKKDASAILYHNNSSADERQVSTGYMENLRKEFIERGVIEVECEYEMGGDLIDNISRLAHTRRATLITMGITGKSAMKQIFFGSNTLKLIDKNLYPVMIIPPDAVYKGINNVAFASDFVNVERTTPSDLIKSVLEMFNPKLHIVNINPDHYVSITEECRMEKEKLEAMFSKYEKDFYFIGINDFFEAIDNFVKDYHIDVLVTIPKHQSNSTPFFKRTHTHKLAFHSHIPILAAHE